MEHTTSTLREHSEQRERESLSPHACLSAESIGRGRVEPECAIRTCFQRDTDRIVHSKTFRRLKHKTQVFLSPEGDHYRTRMTHTLEVARIARTIARGLQLNEDLTEAIALGHDLGHTPFGHAGERSLDVMVTGGFGHHQQSLRVVERLEKGGDGLNLTFEVRDGIVNHTSSGKPATLEGKVVQLSDRIAYLNHDIEDAIRAGVLYPTDIPITCSQVLGYTHSERIGTLVQDIIYSSMGQADIYQSPEMATAMTELRAFMFKHVYKNPVAKGEEIKVHGIISSLFQWYVKHPDDLPTDFQEIRITEGTERAVCDYIAGMTDPFALEQYKKLFIPMNWTIK